MIASGDSVARNAFRVALANSRTSTLETPLPIANATQELDASDILEIRDMAEAIARAEKIVNAPRSSARGLTDLFDSLGRRATDDTIGPAAPAPAFARPTPIPPQFLEMPSALPLAASPAVEDDAYFHPSGRMRSFADVTLDGYRPEPTLLLRARTRRRHFSWILLGALLPFVALAGFAIVSRADLASAAASPVRAVPVAPVAPVATAIATAAPTAPAAAAPAIATPHAPPTMHAAKPTPSIPVFDVNKLPSAGSKSRTR